MSDFESSPTLLLTDTTTNRRTFDSGVEGGASRLIGWDGEVEGALRPFPGFRLLDDGLALNANETLADGDFFVVTLREGASDVRRCYVYRTANSSDNKFDIYVAYDGPGSALVTTQLKGRGDGRDVPRPHLLRLRSGCRTPLLLLRRGDAAHHQHRHRTRPATLG